MNTNLFTTGAFTRAPAVVAISALLMGALLPCPAKAASWPIPDAKEIGRRGRDAAWEKLRDAAAAAADSVGAKRRSDGKVPDDSRDRTAKTTSSASDCQADPFVTLPNGRLLINTIDTSDRDEVAVLSGAVGDPSAALGRSPNHDLFRSDLLVAAFGEGTNSIQELMQKWSKEYRTATSPFNKEEIAQRERKRFAGLLEEARQHSQVAFVVNLGLLKYDPQQRAFLVGGSFLSGFDLLKQSSSVPFTTLPEQARPIGDVIEVPVERARAMLDRVDPIHTKEWRQTQKWPSLTFMAYVEGTIIGGKAGRPAVRMERAQLYGVEGTPKPRATGPAVAELLKTVTIKASAPETEAPVPVVTPIVTGRPFDNMFVQLPDQRCWVGPLYWDKKQLNARVLENFFEGQLPVWLMAPQCPTDQSKHSFDWEMTSRARLKLAVLEMATGPASRTVDDLVKEHAQEYQQAKTEFERMDVIRQQRAYYASLVEKAALITNAAVTVALQPGAYDFTRQGYEAKVGCFESQLTLVGTNGVPLKSVFVPIEEAQARTLAAASRGGTPFLQAYVEARVVHDEEYYNRMKASADPRIRASADKEGRKYRGIILEVDRMHVIFVLYDEGSSMQVLRKIQRLGVLTGPVAVAAGN